MTRFAAVAALVLSVLALALFCLFRPALILKAAVPQQNFLGVLLDDSRSLQIADGNGQARSDFLRQNFGEKGPLLDALSKRFVLRFFRFSSSAERLQSAADLKFDGNTTRLGTALDRARDELAGLPLAGLVMVTDGADTSDAALDESARPMLVVAPCYTGPDPEPEELRALRALPGLASDDVRERPFLEQQALFDSPYGANRHYWKGHFVGALPDDLVDLLLERVAALGRSPGDILIESLHGAPKDVEPSFGAIGYRDAAFNVSAMATWDDPALDAEHVGWARDTASTIEPWAFGGGYANYMQADEPLERVRAAFAHQSFARLPVLKTSTKLTPASTSRRAKRHPWPKLLRP